MPDIGEVTHREERSETTQIVPYRGKYLTVNNYWQYSGDHGGTVWISEDGQIISYSNSRLKMGTPEPKAVVDAFGPLMKRVNETLQKECGLPLENTMKYSRN